MVKMEWKPEDEARFRGVAEGCLSGLLLGLVIFLFIIILLTGCSTCPPCQPRVETVEVQVPVYSCPEAPPLPDIVLPQFPEPPESDSPSEDWIAWYAEMVTVAKTRYEIVLTRMLVIEQLLDEYRE